MVPIRKSAMASSVSAARGRPVTFPHRRIEGNSIWRRLLGDHEVRYSGLPAEVGQRLNSWVWGLSRSSLIAPPVTLPLTLKTLRPRVMSDS